VPESQLFDPSLNSDAVEPAGISHRLETAGAIAARLPAAGTQVADINRQLRSATNFVQHMIWSCLPDGRPDFYNDQFFAYLGVPVQPASAICWFAPIHSQDRSRAIESWERSVATGEPYEVEFRIRHRSGQYRWMLARAAPQRDESGAISRWFGSAIDVEEIIDFRAALARARQGLALESRDRTEARDRAWRHSPDLLCVLDPGGVLRAVNPACTQLLGWLPEELVGGHYADFIHPDDRLVSEAALGAARGKPAPGHQSRVRHKDGSYRWFAWVGSLDGDFIYANGRHITVEKQAAEALACADARLRQSQKLEAIGQLTGGIAHDFNNLLQALSSGLEVLEHRHVQSEEGRRLIRQATGVIDRGATLTRQLLAFARKQQLATRVIDMNATLAASAEFLARSLGGEAVIVWQLDAQVWPAMADPNQLEVSVLNLLLNARDAMPGGGTVTVSTRNVPAGEIMPGELAPGDYVALSVTDTGIGMTDEVRGRACEPFFTTKGVGGGTGLGLSQVYGFARQSNGTVQIVSVPGRGTTVDIVLPRAGNSDTPRVGTVSDAAPHHATILVVDDDADVREMTVAGLEDRGYRVLEADGGASCLRILESEPVALLLVDFAMPVMNGAELVRLTRRTHPDTRVVFMTGYADLEALRSFASPEEILRKPFRLRALVEHVEAALK
jgi:PAS domain S-box-containing protein